ncbi:MAG TPA: tetratricopeptide repeat protein [Kofleriaceae bacterium]|nr:tetratricopeptide repeat protein [Kofleriaceae bacterium]
METPTTQEALGPVTSRTPRLSPDALRTDQAEPIERLADLEGDVGAESEERTSDHAAAVYDLRSRFAGRAGVLDRLLAMFEGAIRDRGIGFAVVVGEAGMGKSRLVSELARVARDRHPSARVIVATAEEHAPSFAVFARLLAQRFGIPGDADLVTARELIVAGVADVLPPARVTEVAHLIAHLMRVPFDDSPVVGPLLEAPQQLEIRTFLALRRLLAADAERQPLLLCVENLELTGPETINLVHYLAAGLRGAPILLVATATAQLYERHPTFGEGEIAPERLELGPLAPAEAETLLRDLLAPLGAVPDRLVTHARGLGGSPRAIHELVRLLLESDCIVHGPGGGWRLDAVRLAETNLPRTYDQLVLTRLAVMESVGRRVLEMAAVIGDVCWMDAMLALERADGLRQGDPDGPTLSQIAASGDHSRATINAALATLIEREWLVEMTPPSLAGERELRFAYPHLRLLVEKNLDDARRRRYHRLVAQWLELRPEGRGAASQEQVARHLERAGETREAASRYRRAADAARTSYSNERAIRLYDRALACVGDSDLAARIHLWHDLGSVYDLIGDFEAALGAFERMLRLSWVGASKAKAAVAFNKMGRVWRRKGDLKLSLEYLERGAELFRAAEDDRGIAGSLDDIGKALQLLGRYDAAHAKITEALQRRGKHGDPRSIAASLSTLGSVQQDRGEYEAAFNCHREALELRKAAGDRFGTVVSQNALAVLHYEAGDAAEARKLWLEALTEAEAIGALPYAAIVLTNLGELALEDGKLEEARSRLEDALEIVEDLEARQLESACCRMLALLENQAGKMAVARELAERALGVATQAGLKEKEGQALLALGQIHATSLYDASRDSEDGEPPAERYFQRGLEVLREIGNDRGVARGLEQYARYQAESGDPDAARDHFREALAIYSRLGSRRADAVQTALAAL